MEQEIEIKVGGIEYLVQVLVDSDERVEDVERVYIYDHNNSRYVDTNADTDEFYNYYEDYINEAYEKYLEDRAVVAAEMRYDAAKEEGLL